MIRFALRALGIVLLTSVAVACTGYYQGPVSITKSESLVAGCQKIGDVAADSKAKDFEVVGALTEAARWKGANYIVVPADGARTGTAYRCQAPTASASH